ncbi:MAG: ABC transporter permease subunit [Paracoccaceae bacterium]
MSTGKHQAFYASFGTVLALLVLTVPVVMVLGFSGAMARKSAIAPLRWFGLAYTNLVRGVPDIIFFLFVPIAMDQGIEYLRHKIKCPEVLEPIRQGNDFVVCTIAKMPLGSSAQWVHEVYGFMLALFAFSIVFGAFAANTLYGAMNAVPHNQLETGAAFGMSPRQVFWRIQVKQMWIYALPGLSNLWMILIKATPLLFLLGVEDIVYWARELGGAKTNRFAYPHPDWRLYYFAFLLVFYLFMTWMSEKVFTRISKRLSHGQAMAGAQS